MSVNYTQTVINNRLQQVVNAVDAGAGFGVLRLLDSGNNPVSSFTLQKPSMTIAGGVATLNGLTLLDQSAVGGTATGARIEDSTGTIVMSGLVVGSDILLSPSNVIVAGQAVALTSATITGH